MVLLNEHGVTNKNKVNIDGYVTFSKNRENRIMGGVSISVKKDEAQHVIKVKEGEKDDEFIIVRNEKFKPAFNVMTIYGEQETRSSKDKILEKWGKILDEINSVLCKGESLIIMGDLNKHVGSDKLGVTGNHTKVSYGGSLVRDLVQRGDLILVNNSEKTTGGPFTRYDPSKPSEDEKKSCLDLALISNDLFRYVDKLIIDNDGQYPIGRVVMKNGLKTLVKSDHYPLILKFKDIPVNRNVFKHEEVVRFNLKKDGGWATYKTLTDECEELVNIVNNDSDSVEKIHAKFESIHNKIKFKSFGKTRITTRSKVKMINENHNGNVDDKVVIDRIIKQKSDILQKEISDLKAGSLSRPAQVFKLIEKIKGPKKVGPEACAIVDPNTKELKTTKRGILVTSSNYYRDLLTNNFPSEGYENDIKIKNALHEARMSIPGDKDGEDCFNDKDFQEALKGRHHSKTKIS